MADWLRQSKRAYHALEKSASGNGPDEPLTLQEFELVLHAQNWHEDRVWFHDANGRLRALPANWTSVVGEDPFNVVAAGRALFRVEELLELGRLIATLEP
jgi:Family of unknown function (DUF5372)